MSAVKVFIAILSLAAVALCQEEADASLTTTDGEGKEKFGLYGAYHAAGVPVAAGAVPVAAAPVAHAAYAAPVAHAAYPAYGAYGYGYHPATYGGAYGYGAAYGHGYGYGAYHPYAAGYAGYGYAHPYGYYR